MKPYLNFFRKTNGVIATLGIILFLSGCGGDIKVTLPNVKLDFGDPVVLTLELKNQNIEVGVKLPIPDLEGAFVELVPNGLAKSPAMAFLSIPAKQFENNLFKLKNPTLLPDGRPLPKIVGKLPSVAIQVPRFKDITFYLGTEIAAIFFPTTVKFDPDIEITVSLSDAHGRKVGFLTRIPAIHGENGGFFTSFNWNLVVSNPNEHATIHENDLKQSFINDPRAKKNGYNYEKPIDLRDYFKLP